MEPPRKMHYWLYALRLEQGKYYVGITTKTVERRFAEHVQRKGANYTQTYHPIEIIESQDLGILSKEDAETKENERTREYMRRFGVSNVHGGDLNSTEDYGRLFNRIYTQDTRNAMLAIVLLLVTVVVLIIEAWH